MTELVFILDRSGSMSGLEGDTIGSPYEFDRGDKTKDFPLFSRRSSFTDDTVMTLRVPEPLAG